MLQLLRVFFRNADSSVSCLTDTSVYILGKPLDIIPHYYIKFFNELDCSNTESILTLGVVACFGNRA